MASRTAQKLPAAPVFTREVVAVPEVGRGRKGASDLEAAIRTNAEAAQEARRVALAQRRALEEIAAQRAAVEKQLAGLRRDMAEERSEHERLVAQARFRATQEERRRHENAPDASGPAINEAVVASPAMRAVQGQVAEREQLGESHRQRLLEALRERDAARLELQRVSDARTHAERRLERVTEVLHRATSSPGPLPSGSDGVDTQAVRALRDELAVAIARAKSAESRTNELRDEIETVKNQRVSTTESLEVTRDDLDNARDELASLHAQLIELEAEQRKGALDPERIERAHARARELEAEADAARERAAVAEREVSRLSASLQSTADRADLSLAVTHDLQGELAEVRTRYSAAEAEVIDVAGRARQAEAEHQARTSELESQLQAAVIEHGHHAVDLEATHAATAAELTSASAQAEHLAHQIDEARARVGQLETALAATTAALADTTDRLAAREAEFAEARERSTIRDAELEELEAALTTAAEDTFVALARADELAAALADSRELLAANERALATAHEEFAGAAKVADGALATARAERDVAVAQADSLTLELEQQQTARKEAEALAADRERLHLEVETEQGDALARLDDLSRELGVLRADREVLVERADAMTERTEHLELELTAARTRADDLEATRSEDRRVAEQAIGALRVKTDAATARSAQVESEMQELRSRHGDERDRFARDLDAAPACVDEEERTVQAPAPARAKATVPSEPSRSPATRRRAPATPYAPVLEPEPVSACAAEVTPTPEPPRPPSELRRAVFASLTELAGDG